MKRPDPTDYFEYYGTYIDRVPDGDILSILRDEGARTLELLSGLPDARAEFRYKPDKWSIKEIVGHVIDVERVLSYRALSIARGDPAPLPGIEQDDWARVSNAGARSFPDLLDEFDAVRRASVLLFKSLDDEAAARRGKASGYEFRVSAFPYIIAGHDIHHRGVIEERYLGADG